MIVLLLIKNVKSVGKEKIIIKINETTNKQPNNNTMKCYEVETNEIVTTDGQRRKILKCFCGTTICQKLSKGWRYVFDEQMEIRRKKQKEQWNYEGENEMTKSQWKKYYKAIGLNE